MHGVVVSKSILWFYRQCDEIHYKCNVYLSRDNVWALHLPWPIVCWALYCWSAAVKSTERADPEDAAREIKICMPVRNPLLTKLYWLLNTQDDGRQPVCCWTLLDQAGNEL